MKICTKICCCGASDERVGVSRVRKLNRLTCCQRPLGSVLFYLAMGSGWRCASVARVQSLFASPEAELPLVKRLGLRELLHVCVWLALVLEAAEVTVLGILGDHGHLGKQMQKNDMSSHQKSTSTHRGDPFSGQIRRCSIALHATSQQPLDVRHPGRVGANSPIGISGQKHVRVLQRYNSTHHGRHWVQLRGQGT